MIYNYIMKKLKILSIMLLLTFAVTSYASARSDSIGTAIGFLNDFDFEQAKLLKRVSEGKEVKAFLNSSEEAFNETFAEIKTLRWSEKPSRKRFNRVYNAYLAYTTGRIDALTVIEGKVAEKDKVIVNSAITRLTEIKKTALNELTDISAKEDVKEDRLKVSPVIDRSKYENHPGDSKGLYER